jgi:hypothetical protein
MSNEIETLSNESLYAQKEAANRELLRRKCEHKNKTQIVYLIASSLHRREIRSPNYPCVLTMRQCLAIVYRKYEQSETRVDVLLASL